MEPPALKLPISLRSEVRATKPYYSPFLFSESDLWKVVGARRDASEYWQHPSPLAAGSFQSNGPGSRAPRDAEPRPGRSQADRVSIKGEAARNVSESLCFLTLVCARVADGFGNRFARRNIYGD